MKRNNPTMEDDLREEYDLKSLTVRKLGSGRKKNNASESLSDIGDEINNLISILKEYFISKYDKDKSMRLKKNKKLKFFLIILIGITLLSVLYNIFTRSSLFWLPLVTSIISVGGFALMWLMPFYVFSRPYQDELNDIEKVIKENIKRINCLNNKKSRDKYRDPQKLGFTFLKSQFEYRIQKIENDLKIIDQGSYVIAPIFGLVILIVIIIPSLPQSAEFLFKDPTYSLPLGILLFLISLVQPSVKIILCNLKYSLIGNHQECLHLLEQMEAMTYSTE